MPNLKSPTETFIILFERYIISMTQMIKNVFGYRTPRAKLGHQLQQQTTAN